MPDPIRTEKVVGFTRMVNDTIVRGLRRVFTSAYAEKQLRDLRIVTEYPLTRTEYPAIIIDFEDGTNKSAGIGHQEIFYDVNGILRIWDHRRFDGRINFQCMGLTPIDRDIIYDAVIECLAFGHLPHLTLQQNLFSELYGSPDDPGDPFKALSQLFLNTDVMKNGGKNVVPAPWGAEDSLIYSKTLSVDVVGGFYNATPALVTAGTEFITDVFVYPHLREQLTLPLYESDDDYVDPEVGEILDAYVVEADPEASATETFVE